MTTMDCQQALNEIGPFVDGELPPSDWPALEAHLAECNGCRMAYGELLVADAALTRSFRPRRRAGAELADRVIEQLRIDGVPRRWLRAWAVPLVAAAAGFMLAVVVFHGGGERPDGQAEAPLARLALATGPTQVRPVPNVAWLGCPTNSSIAAGAAVRTSDAARCEIEANDGTQIRLDAGTVIELPTPRCVRLAQGELYSSVPDDRKKFKIELPDAVIAATRGKFDVSCAPGAASLTVIEGTADVACKSGTCSVVAGQRVRLIDGQVQETGAVVDPLQATAWINELLLLKDPENPELIERLNDILAQIGHAKISYLYEDEIRRLGSRAALPLLRYVSSPRSRSDAVARVAAARIAADLADETAIGDLIALLDDKDPLVRFHVRRALVRLAGGDQGSTIDTADQDPQSLRAVREAWKTWWKSRSNAPDRPSR